MNEDIKTQIQKRIDELSNEIQELVAERESISSRIDEIEVRLHQCVGSIKELHGLIKE